MGLEDATPPPERTDEPDAPEERLPYAATALGATYASLPPLPVVVVLDSVRSLYNVGAFFRTADAVALERLVLCGITGTPPRREISKTALGAESTVPWVRASDALTAVDACRAQGHEIAAIETSATAVDLFDWTPRFPVCLLFGHEVDGVSSPLLERCDTHVRIPMLGRKHSLNVATAGGVVLFELLRKFRRAHEARLGVGERGDVVPRRGRP